MNRESHESSDNRTGQVTRVQWVIAECAGFAAAGGIVILFFLVSNVIMGREIHGLAAMAAMAAIVLTASYKMASWTKERITVRFLHDRRRHD